MICIATLQHNDTAFFGAHKGYQFTITHTVTMNYKEESAKCHQVGSGHETSVKVTGYKLFSLANWCQVTK